MGIARWRMLVNPWLLRQLPSIAGMALWPFALVEGRQLAPGTQPRANEVAIRKGGRVFGVEAALLRHERIHLRQQAELLVLPFYIWYLTEYLVLRLRLPHSAAYRRIRFEREAYAHENDPTYLAKRRPWAFLNV